MKVLRSLSQCGSGAARTAVALSVAMLTFAAAPAWLPSLTASASQSGGTFRCEHLDGNGKVIVDIDGAMTPGTKGSIDATPNNPVLTVGNEKCFLSGTIPSGWSITEGPAPLTLQNGSANNGSLTLTNWFDSFTQSNYSTTVFGSTFTNRGRLVETNDPQGVATIPLTIRHFINSRGGGVSTSRGGELDFIDPSATAGGDFDNHGSLSLLLNSTIQMQGQKGFGCTSGDELVLEKGGTLNNRGLLSLDCGGLLVKGGTETGTQPFTITPDTTEPISFARSAPSVKASAARTIDLVDKGAILHGVLPHGWQIDALEGQVLGAADGSGNRGVIDLETHASLIGPGARFTNWGNVVTRRAANNSSALISVKDFVNKAHAGVSTTNGVELDFDYRTSSAASMGTIENFGTFTSSHGGLIKVGDGYCPIGSNYDGEKLTLEPHGELAGSTSDVMQCGTFLANGGTISASTPLSVQPNAVTLKFGAHIPAGPGHGANTIQIDGGNAAAMLAGTLARGWTIHVMIGSLGAKAGATNAGSIDLSADQGIVDQGAFTNTGRIVVDQNQSAELVATTFTNKGTIQLNDGSVAQFRGPSGASINVLNKGTLSLTSHTALQLSSAGKILDKSGSTTKLTVDSAPSGDVMFSETGAIHLGGILDLVTPSSFRPASGSQYSIARVLGSSTLSGSFARVNGLKSGHGASYSLKRTPQSLTATVSG